VLDRAASPTDRESRAMTAAPRHTPPAATRPSAAEIRSLDPYAFLAVLGKRVIHPGGRRSTQQLLELAGLAAGQQVLEIGCGVATTTIQVAQRFNAQVTAADLAPLMLARASRNVASAGLDGQVKVERADIGALAIAARAMSRPSYLRKMAWLMPRMQRAVPYLGYVVIAATKPAA